MGPWTKHYCTYMIVLHNGLCIQKQLHAQEYGVKVYFRSHGKQQNGPVCDLNIHMFIHLYLIIYLYTYHHISISSVAPNSRVPQNTLKGSQSCCADWYCDGFS